MTPARFVTLAGPVQAQIEVKRSRFLCDLVPIGAEAPGAGGSSVGVSGEQDAAGDPAAQAEARARAIIDAARSTLWDARHHCSAFVIGPDARVRRSNDDGEPSGTAGAPMLDALVGAGLTDVVAVVTRWFGGTLLGAGGLVRAYGDAVREALAQAQAQTVIYEQRELRRVDVALADVGRIEHALRAAGVEVNDVDYVSGAAQGRAGLELAIAPDALTETGARLAELTGGPIDLVGIRQGWARL